MKTKYVWCTLIVLRWISVIWPQSGYIHPDEFFQSVEVVSGDVLQIDVHKTWEFKPSKPIRSTFIPCLLYWPAFVILKACAACGVCGSLLSVYSMVIAPRIAVSLMGSLTDILVYKLLKLYKGFDVDVGMLMYTSSYVTLVYYTRTLSNTVESFIFILMVYVIQKNIKKFSQYDKIHPRTIHTKCTRKNYPIAENIDYLNAIDVILISVCLVGGIFNRPTFVLFAYAPYFHWLCDGYLPEKLSDIIDSFKFIMAKIKITMLIIAPTLIVFIVWDTNYYHGSNLIMTPLNFIDYNWKSENLEKHGTHSRFTHLFVNIPLLFGPIIICVLYDIIVYVMTKGNISAKRTSVIDGIDTKFWIHSYAVPIMLLSMFPHQEPRFLIPLLLPFVVLYSHLIFGYRSIKLFKIMWIVFNILGGLFYGCFHQGRLLSAIEYMKYHVDSSNSSVNHIMFSHTYMPPKHLFTIKGKNDREYNHKYVYNLFSSQSLKALYNDKVKFVPESKIKIFDMKGTSLSNVEEKIDTFGKKFKGHHRTYLVIPSSMELQVCTQKSNQYIYVLIKQFKGHLTMEDLPSLEYFNLNKEKGFPKTLCSEESIDNSSTLGQYSSLYALNIYQVQSKSELL